MKEWDNTMFNFLKEQKWNQRKDEKDEKGRNQYEEKSYFVVDCSQLLGIGGEAVVIRKSVQEKVGGVKPVDLEYEALKIIPIMKHNFENEKIEEMEKRVTERHKQADIETFVNKSRNLQARGNQEIDQRYDNPDENIFIKNS